MYQRVSFSRGVHHIASSASTSARRAPQVLQGAEQQEAAMHDHAVWPVNSDEIRDATEVEASRTIDKQGVTLSS